MYDEIIANNIKKEQRVVQIDLFTQMPDVDPSFT